jgi:hypothetical protein
VCCQGWWKRMWGALLPIWFCDVFLEGFNHTSSKTSELINYVFFFNTLIGSSIHAFMH